MSETTEIDLAKVVASTGALERVPARIAHKHGILPISFADDRLSVVQADPEDLMGPAQLESQLGVDVVVLPVNDPESVRRAIRRYYPDTAGEDAQTPLGLLERLVNRAIQIHCSDIHLDPEEERGVIRLRVDGVMREDGEMSRDMLVDLISAIKVAARLDIAEKRVPQDGQLGMESLGESVSMRVATVPTAYGEKATLRILASAALAEDLERLDALGMRGNHYETFLSALDHAYGVILLSGPTGSGKTTTLYAALRHLREPGTKHILSIEDPVEVPIRGINQIPVNSDRVSFATALRSALRHDPDAIMIGEIRDPETADIAVKSALTGHLVLSTLHANTSVSVIARLANLGVPADLVASTLRLVVAQRLVRRPCMHCVEQASVTEQLAAEFGWTDQGLTVPKPVGCPLCAQTGYAGRLGLYELVPVDRAVRGMILDHAAEDTMAKHLFGEKGYLTLLGDGREKILSGKTTPDEVRRVTFLGEGG